MFFIHRGQVDVVSEDGLKVFASMHDGAFFGQYRSKVPINLNCIYIGFWLHTSL
jgi:hypothetical protein